MHRKVRPSLRQACNKDQIGLLGPPFSSVSKTLEAIAREAGSVLRPNDIRNKCSLSVLVKGWFANVKE